MWKLKKVGDSILEQYAQEMMKGLRERIVEGRTVSGTLKKLSNNQIRILVPNYNTPQEDLSELKRLLTLEPVALYDKCCELMNSLIPAYNEVEFPDYIKAKAKKVKTLAEQTLVNKYSLLDDLRLLFNYDDQISKNKDRAYWLTNVKDAEVCTYCNRQYVFTVSRVESNDTDEYIARPELDHWFSKEMYPLMSLSFYNLIPSCHTCNSSAKGNILFNLNDYVHPYLQREDNPSITFRPTLTPMASKYYGVAIDRVKDSIEDRTIKAFALDEIYASHGPLEVNDIMTFNYAYSNGYLKILFEQVLANNLGSKSKAEVYKMLFGTEMEPKDFGKRPLSKLKYDILKYLKVI